MSWKMVKNNKKIIFKKWRHTPKRFISNQVLTFWIPVIFVCRCQGRWRLLVSQSTVAKGDGPIYCQSRIQSIKIQSFFEVNTLWVNHPSVISQSFPSFNHSLAGSNCHEWLPDKNIGLFDIDAINRSINQSINSVSQTIIN